MANGASPASRRRSISARSGWQQTVQRRPMGGLSIFFVSTIAYENPPRNARFDPIACTLSPDPIDMRVEPPSGKSKAGALVQMGGTPPRPVARNIG